MMCGGLVVEDAGILSHAAVMARELGIPAVIAVDATRLVPDAPRSRQTRSPDG